MRAIDILHTRLTVAMGFMHKARWRALWRTVQALLVGERLWLTSLGRSLPGGVTPKHAIKAVDRLLGNVALRGESERVYAAVGSALLTRTGACPVLAVDTMQIRPGAYALTAAIACDGRALPIYSIVTKIGKPKKPVLDRFLRGLAKVLPANCRPVLVSDAGFESPWFEAVQEMGWDYVGRLRNRTSFCLGGQWVTLQRLCERVTNRSRNLGLVEFPKCKGTRARRIVLSKQPKSLHRQRLTTKGRPGRRGQDQKSSKAAREPWVLATSLTSRPSAIVAAYALRMQIEETFRDTKNPRWGWSLRECRSRSHARLEMLLLIAAIAYFVRISIGQAGEQLHLHRRHQANTIRKRRVLSLFVLGGLLLQSDDHGCINQVSLNKAIRELRRKVSALSEATT